MDFDMEARLADAGYGRVAGVDEVGRGPWAGPVSAAAVVFHAPPPPGLRDSKKLSRRQRAALYALIAERAHISVSHVSVEEIAQYNILQASLIAMRRAVEGLFVVPDYLLFDGRYCPEGLQQPARGIVRGDAQIASIAAASIIAKVARDEIMSALAKEHPGYGWERNAGYGTPEHRASLERLGVTQHHRSSFAPIRKMLYGA